MLHNSPSALELTPVRVCSFVLLFSPVFSIVFSWWQEMCVTPPSEPLVDHRPRSEWLEEDECMWGPTGGIVTIGPIPNNFIIKH